MNPLLYMLAGAAALAVAYGAIIVGRKAGRAARDLTSALAGIPRLIKAIADNSEALNKFSGELEFLRTAMVGGSPNFGPENPEAPATTRKPLAPFPGAPPFIPDATEDETLIIEQDDEALVQQEQLENVRGQGFEAEPETNPPGVTRDV